MLSSADIRGLYTQELLSYQLVLLRNITIWVFLFVKLRNSMGPELKESQLDSMMSLYGTNAIRVMIRERIEDSIHQNFEICHVYTAVSRSFPLLLYRWLVFVEIVKMWPHRSFMAPSR
jgi:hypothetical protein